jgi:hypothetical protein
LIACGAVLAKSKIGGMRNERNHTPDLFESAVPDTTHELLAPDAWLLHGFAVKVNAACLTAVEQISAAAPFRHLETPGAFACQWQ